MMLAHTVLASMPMGHGDAPCYLAALDPFDVSLHLTMTFDTGLIGSIVLSSQADVQERLAEAEDRASRQAWGHAEALQVRPLLLTLSLT